MPFPIARDRRPHDAGLCSPNPHYSALSRKKARAEARRAERYLKKNVKVLTGAGVGYCHELIILTGTLSMLFLTMP